ncbi:hypothetical protein KDK_59060 [Dictyobacter kobayashii]|uniref:Uncharacterized protein n=1 Tax=Dictyobacter kobayashii TaxID=2014872 RepID=A0A402ASL9_9CHLR|nr:hypothetical protein KDK_59060 [Dictyobacter kobayashii]
MAERVVDLTCNPVALADNREFLHLSAIRLELRMGQREFADRRRASTGGAKRDQEDHLATDIPLPGEEAEREAGT